MKNKIINKLLNSQAREKQKTNNTNGVKYIRLNKIIEKLSNKPNEIKGRLSNLFGMGFSQTIRRTITNEDKISSNELLLKMKLKEIRVVLVNKIKNILKNNYDGNVKFFLVRLGEIAVGEEENEESKIITRNLESLELIHFAMVSSKFLVKENNGGPDIYVTMAILGIRSIIGYNPNIKNMISDKLSTLESLLEIEEIDWDSTNAVFNFLKEINKDIYFLDFGIWDRYDYMIDHFRFLIEGHPGIHYKKLKRNEDTYLLEKNLAFNTYINNKFDETTALLAVTSYLALGETNLDLVAIEKFLKKKFPEQLKYIDLMLIFQLNLETINKIINYKKIQQK